MELKEAILHARQVAGQECGPCAYQHDELVDFLEELEAFRASGLTPEEIARASKAMHAALGLACEAQAAKDAISHLTAQVRALETERDAAKADIAALLRGCECEHRHEYCRGSSLEECSRHWPGDCSGAEWRGLEGTE